MHVCHATFANAGRRGSRGVGVARWVADGSAARGITRLWPSSCSLHISTKDVRSDGGGVFKDMWNDEQ